LKCQTRESQPGYSAMGKYVPLTLTVLIAVIAFGISFTAIRIFYYESVPVMQEYFFPATIGSVIGGFIGFWRLRSKWYAVHLEQLIALRTAKLQKKFEEQKKEALERKKTEESLRKSEEKYRTLVNSVPDLIIELNDKAEITSINEPFLDNFVYQPEDVIGETFFDFIHPDDVDLILKMFQDAIKNKAQSEKGPEIRIVDKDGTLHWFEFNAKMSFDAHGNYLKAFGVAREITARKQAEEALQESENWQRFMSDNITDFMWIADLDLKRFKFLSSSVNRIGEGVYETLMALDIKQTLIEESYQLACDRIREELDLEKNQQDQKNLSDEELKRFEIIELGWHGMDGNTFWTETVTQFQRDENNVPIAVYGVSRDINQRRQAEKEMQKLMSLIENSQDFISLSTLEGNMTFINKAGLEMVGLESAEKAKKLKIFDFVPKSVNSKLNQEVLPVIMSNQHWINQTRFKNFKTGETFPIEINMFAVGEVDSSESTAIAIIGRNLTERQIIEEQLRQSQKMESLGTLSGGIAHDFNNILGVIVGYAGLVLDTLPENSDERSYQEEVIKASDRATNLINQIRSFSRTQEIDLKPVRIAPVIKEALKMMRAVIPTTIEIKQDISSEGGYSMADTNQIHQIVVNLVNNAGQAMKKTGSTIDVSLSQVTSANCGVVSTELVAEKYLKLVVKDDGEGMTKKVSARIFEPFFTTKAVNEGTGLGLSIVHGIVMSHKGLIQVDSSIGKGSIISILLPVAEGVVGEEPEKQEIITKDRGKGHILVVDDEVSLTKYYSLVLEKLGYEITTANDGKFALDLFKQQPDLFDIIFTDQTMPAMTGTQLSQEIQAIKPEIPIILATGYAGIVTETELNELNISSFLKKPIKLPDLLNSINLAGKCVADKKKLR